MRGDSDESMLNKIFLGEVASVQNYGAFIRIPGGNNQGLVHRTQISSVNVPDASEVLAKDDRVWCKVISINPDGKIALSMKVVDQGNGKDLDPNGVQIRLDEQKRKEWVPGGQRKVISLDAVYNTTCSKCGTKGHLGKDCFQAAGGKTYELLTEEDDPKTPTVKNIVASSDEKKLKKKEKKEAKKIKKAKKKLKKALKKQKKKEKKLQSKRKKRKKSSSEDSSDSSSDSSSESEDDKKLESHGNPSKRKHEHRPSSSRSPSPSKYKRHHPSPSKASHVSRVRSGSKSRSPSMNSRRKPQSCSPERSARSRSPHRSSGSQHKKRSR